MLSDDTAFSYYRNLKLLYHIPSNVAAEPDEQHDLRSRRQKDLDAWQKRWRRDAYLADDGIDEFDYALAL